jgi:hypothetical protein
MCLFVSLVWMLACGGPETPDIDKIMARYSAGAPEAAQDLADAYRSNPARYGAKVQRAAETLAPTDAWLVADAFAQTGDPERITPMRGQLLQAQFADDQVPDAVLKVAAAMIRGEEAAVSPTWLDLVAEYGRAPHVDTAWRHADDAQKLKLVEALVRRQAEEYLADEVPPISQEAFDELAKMAGTLPEDEVNRKLIERPLNAAILGKRLHACSGASATEADLAHFSYLHANAKEAYEEGNRMRSSGNAAEAIVSLALLKRANEMGEIGAALGELATWLPQAEDCP